MFRISSFSKIASLFVTNGGYGGVNQSIRHGVPLVIAGMDGDKPMTSARVSWSGCGFNLNRATSTPEQVRQAVDTIQSDQRYKIRALEMKGEAEGYDPLSIIVEEIYAMAEGKHTDGTSLRNTYPRTIE